jgi:hypothetical protein
MADFKADGCILTGSLTEASAGVPFIAAGTNITTAVNANGSITINSSAGGTVDGSGTATQLAYWVDSDTLTSNSGMAWDGSELTANKLISTKGAVFNNSNGATASADVRVATDTVTHALFVDAGNDSVIISNTSDQVMKVDSTGVVFNDDHHADIDFRVETDTVTHALFVDAGNETVTISNANDQVMKVDSTGVVFNDDHHADIDFRVETDTITHALFVDAGLETVSIGNANEVVMKVDSTGVVFNDEHHADIDFRIETDTEPSAFKVNAGTNVITTAVPVIHEAGGFLGYYNGTTGTWSDSTGNYNIFKDSNWSSNPTWSSTSGENPANMTFSQNSGQFRSDVEATMRYSVTVNVVVEETSGNGAAIVLTAELNGSTVYSLSGMTVVNKGNTPMFSMSFVTNMADTNVLEFFIDSSDTIVVISASASIYTV